MEYCPEFKELLNDPKWKGQYIGVGNPNAKILIVGKECALEENTLIYQKTFEQNWKDWVSNDNTNTGFDSIEEWKTDNEIFEKYNPLFPFFKQKNKNLRKLKDGSFNGGTSNTWINYQKLFNLYRKRNKGQENYDYIDFFKDCFITELSSVCRHNNKSISSEERKKTERSIAERYDLMKATSFFQKFDTIIMACGGYAEKLDTKLMFGDAKIINTNPLNGNRLPQLSFAISNELLNEIAKQL